MTELGRGGWLGPVLDGETRHPPEVADVGGDNRRPGFEGDGRDPEVGRADVPMLSDQSRRVIEGGARVREDGETPELSGRPPEPFVSEDDLVRGLGLAQVGVPTAENFLDGDDGRGHLIPGRHDAGKDRLLVGEQVGDGVGVGDEADHAGS